MPAMANIVINDGAATPVAHTFSPSGRDQNMVFTWHDRSGGIAIGYPRISVQSKFPANAGAGASSDAKSRVIRQSIKVVLPILEVTAPTTGTGIQPAPTKSYDVSCNMEFILPERSTLQNRKDVFAFVKNLLANAMPASLVQDLEVVTA